MFRRLAFILFVTVFSCAYSCGIKKHQSINNSALSAEQITEENCNFIGENLQAFLTLNTKPLKTWPFKDWGYRIVGNTLLKTPRPEGVRIIGDVLREFLSIDQVNHYHPFLNESKSEWVEMLLKAGAEYHFYGTLDISDSLDCYIYTVENKQQIGYCDAFALLVKDGKAVESVQLACEGYGLFDSIESNRISRNTFVMASFSLDEIQENGDNVAGYYFIHINDDGKVNRSEAMESDFNKPTWRK